MLLDCQVNPVPEYQGGTCIMSVITRLLMSARLDKRHMKRTTHWKRRREHVISRSFVWKHFLYRQFSEFRKWIWQLREKCIFSLNHCMYTQSYNNSYESTRKESFRWLICLVLSHIWHLTSINYLSQFCLKGFYLL